MRQISDEEYVEKTRKKVKSVHRLRWLWPSFFLCYFGLFIWFLQISEQVEPKPDHYEVWGFVSGAIMGLGFGFTTFAAGICLRNWWDSYRGWRTERLLLKYYDEHRLTSGTRWRALAPRNVADRHRPSSGDAAFHEVAGAGSLTARRSKSPKGGGFLRCNAKANPL